MSTGLKLKNSVLAVLLSSGLLCAGTPAWGTTPAQAQQQSRKAHKKKEAEPPPPLPSGPTGPVPPMPLDAMAAVPPQVTYANNQLTIVAPNSTLGDILRAVRKQTGAEIEVPAAPERVVTHLGPGPAREVLADLLNGSRFNYVFLGSPSDESALTRVVLVPKSGAQEIAPNSVAQNNPGAPGQPPEMAQPEPAAEANDAEAADDNNNAEDNNSEQQPAEAEQAPVPDQNGIKTPQQMLQEMQQRQMQMQQQQQQQPGQPPNPGSGMPPHPPQQN